MAKKTAIIIPTYGKRADHMLLRLLLSIRNLEEKDFIVIILNNTIDVKQHKITEKKIKGIIEKYKNCFEVVHVGYKELGKLYEYLHKEGFADFIDYVNLKGYSNFRNLGLIVANILGIDIVIFLDDDEVILDKNFLKLAREYVGKGHNKKRIGGIAGYYVNKNGSYLLPEYDLKKQWWIRLWNKPKYMNKAFRIIENENRLNETSFAFAGNIVLHRNMFRNVLFDPYIQRGEDVDLLINAKYLGYVFLLDNKLRIKHLPPGKTNSDVWLEIRKDAYRFIYEREKVLGLIKEGKLEKNIIKSLDPYPGYFIRKDVQLRLVITCLLLGIRVLFLGKFKDAIEHFRNIKIAIIDAKEYAIKNSGKYKRLQRGWASLMGSIDKDKYLKECLNNKYE